MHSFAKPAGLLYHLDWDAELQFQLFQKSISKTLTARALQGIPPSEQDSPSALFHSAVLHTASEYIFRNGHLEEIPVHPTNISVVTKPKSKYKTVDRIDHVAANRKELNGTCDNIVHDINAGLEQIRDQSNTPQDASATASKMSKFTRCSQS